MPSPTREQIDALIIGMCCTSRHDFGLLSESERAPLIRDMEQLYRHDIAPFVAALSAERKPVAQPGEQEAEGRRESEWATLSMVLDRLTDDYEFRGEEGDHTPTDDERALMRDYIEGVLADNDFMAAFSQVYPMRQRLATPPDERRAGMEEARKEALEEANTALHEVFASETMSKHASEYECKAARYAINKCITAIRALAQRERG